MAGTERAEHAGERPIDGHGEGLQQADQQRSDEGAGQRAQSAHHHHHEQDRSEQARHVRLRHQGRTGDDAGNRRQRRAEAEHQHEDAADIVAEVSHHVRVGQRRLHDHADPGFLDADQQRREDRDRDHQHEHLVGGVIGGENRESGEIERGGHAVVHRALAPDHLHHFLDRKRKTEGEQQFGDMAVLVHGAQAVALDRGAERARQRRCDHQRRPEAEPAAQLKTEERADHVEAGVREVEHAEHAEDNREAAGHQEQQHSEQDAVQRRYDDQFEHDEPPAICSFQPSL